MRQKFPAGIGNRRFAFGLSHWWWLAIGQQGSAFWHKLCICDLKYTIPSWHHLGASPSEQRQQNLDRNKKGREGKLDIWHTILTLAKSSRDGWWSISLSFFGSNSSMIFVMWTEDGTHPTNCKVSSRNYREENSSFCIRRRRRRRAADTFRLFS